MLITFAANRDRELKLASNFAEVLRLRVRHDNPLVLSSVVLHFVNVGQVELVVWDALAIDLNFEDAVKLQCPIAILTILADRCARTDHTSYQPLVMIEHLQATRF